MSERNLTYFDCENIYDIESNRHYLNIISDKEFIEIQSKIINYLFSNMCSEDCTEIQNISEQLDDLQDKKEALEEEVSDIEKQIKELSKNQ